MALSGAHSVPVGYRSVFDGPERKGKAGAKSLVTFSRVGYLGITPLAPGRYLLKRKVLWILERKEM